MSLYDSLALEGARMLSFEMSHNFGICSIQRTIQVFKKASGLKKNKYSSVLYANSAPRFLLFLTAAVASHLL